MYFSYLTLFQYPFADTVFFRQARTSHTDLDAIAFQPAAFLDGEQAACRFFNHGT
jgi:hypothetical protein